MKKVFTRSDDVIHLFAQRTQDEARCSNVYFNDMNRIYSYGSHYLLGHFIDNNTILINDRGYSVTTSKHISELRWATKQYKQFFVTETNLNDVHGIVKWNIDKLANARKPELYIQPILSLWTSLNEYYKHTKAKKYKSLPMYREIKKIVTNLNNNLESFKDVLLEQNKKRAKKIVLEAKKRLKEFYNYEINTFRIGKLDFLRVSYDERNIETTQGIRIRIREALKLYEIIVAKIDVIGYYIAGYRVRATNGTLKIGCHNIDMKSVHRTGKMLQCISMRS